VTALTGRLLGYFPQDSDEWHAARATRIGASEIGAICGWSPWQTRADVMARKLGQTERTPQTNAQQRGHLVESAVADWFAEETGATYLLPESNGTYVHPDHDHHLANPDRLCADGTVLEAKSAREQSLADGWGRAGSGQVPLTYQAQCMWLCHVLGADVCHLAVLFGQPFEFKKYRIRRDEAVIAYLVREADAFHADLMSALAQKEAA
jgi:putative phage-type endonuclease